MFKLVKSLSGDLYLGSSTPSLLGLSPLGDVKEHFVQPKHRSGFSFCSSFTGLNKGECKCQGGADRRHAQQVLCSHTDVLPQHIQLVSPSGVDLEELCTPQR